MTLWIAGSIVGTGVATGGTYTIQVSSPLADGTYSITAMATDAVGNTSAASGALSLTIDATPPAAPPAPSLVAGDDTGVVGDGITSVPRPRLSGTAEAGATVKLWIAGSVVGTGAATGGAYSIQFNAALADGTYSVTATATDAAGNVSAAGPAFTLKIDTTAPAAPAAPGLLAADDSGATGDGITNVKQPRLTGTAEAGSTVKLWVAGVVAGTGVATSGTYTIQLSSPLADGIYSITATATDAAGNTSAASVGVHADDRHDALQRRRRRPSLLAADDTGVVGDGITSVTRPRLSGTAEAGATVKLWIGGSVVGTGVATGGAYTVQLSAALGDGTYSVTATATDAAGNVSAAGPAFVLTIDTTAPAAPSVPALLAADDSGTTGDGITNVKQPRLTGTAAAGATVRLYVAGSLIGTGVATGGVYTIQAVRRSATGRMASPRRPRMPRVTSAPRAARSR